MFESRLKNVTCRPPEQIIHTENDVGRKQVLNLLRALNDLKTEQDGPRGHKCC